MNSMDNAGKIYNIIQEMINIEIGIVGISEKRWPLQGKKKINNHIVHYYGSENVDHRFNKDLTELLRISKC